MGRMFIRVALVFVFLGLGSFAFALSDSEKWLAKGFDARNREDYPRAFQCFQMAADLGNAKAEYNLGYCYLTAQGVVHDDVEAVKWFQKSADQGDAQGLYSLGSCYENGYGVVQDQGKAKDYYQKAAQQGFKGGETGLNRLNGVPSASSEQPAEAPAANAANDGGDKTDNTASRSGYALTLKVPQGWVVCEKGMTQSAAGPVPASIIKQSKDPNLNFVAYDPKASQNHKEAYMNLMEIHYGGLSEKSEEIFLKKRGMAYEKAIRRTGGDMIENEVLTLSGRSVLKMNGHIPSKRTNSTFLIYIFMDKHHMNQISYSTDQDIFDSYAPVFQESIDKTLQKL